MIDKQLLAVKKDGTSYPIRLPQILSPNQLSSLDIAEIKVGDKWYGNVRLKNANTKSINGYKSVPAILLNQYFEATKEIGIDPKMLKKGAFIKLNQPFEPFVELAKNTVIEKFTKTANAATFTELRFTYHSSYKYIRFNWDADLGVEYIEYNDKINLFKERVKFLDRDFFSNYQTGNDRGDYTFEVYYTIPITLVDEVIASTEDSNNKALAEAVKEEQKQKQAKQKEAQRNELIEQGKALYFNVESAPHNEDLSTVILNRPAPNDGTFTLTHRVNSDVWKNLKAAGNGRYYDKDWLEDMDMFFSSPGWRYGFGAIKWALENGYRVFADDKEIKALSDEQPKTEIAESVLERFELKPPNDLDQVQEHIDYILSNYSSRSMAAMMAVNYINEIDLNLGKKYLQKLGVKTIPEFKEKMKNRQSKVRKDVLEKRNKEIAEIEKVMTDSRVNDMINIANAQNEAMNQQIEQTQQKIDILKPYFKEKYNVDVRLQYIDMYSKSTPFGKEFLMLWDMDVPKIEIYLNQQPTKPTSLQNQNKPYIEQKNNMDNNDFYKEFGIEKPNTVQELDNVVSFLLKKEDSAIMAIITIESFLKNIDDNTVLEWRKEKSLYDRSKLDRYVQKKFKEQANQPTKKIPKGTKKYEIRVDYEDTDSEPVYKETFDTLDEAKAEFDTLKVFEEGRNYIFRKHTKVLSEIFLDEEGDIIDDKQLDLVNYYINENTDKIIELLKEDLEKKYNIQFNQSFGRYADYEYDENLKPITIRVADHSENVTNQERFGSEYSLSIVVANKDSTKNKFGNENAFYRTNKNIEISFGENDDYEIILDQIDSAIEELKDLIEENDEDEQQPTKPTPMTTPNDSHTTAKKVIAAYQKAKIKSKEDDSIDLTHISIRLINEFRKELQALIEYHPTAIPESFWLAITNAGGGDLYSDRLYEKNGDYTPIVLIKNTGVISEYPKNFKPQYQAVIDRVKSSLSEKEVDIWSTNVEILIEENEFNSHALLDENGDLYSANIVDSTFYNPDATLTYQIFVKRNGKNKAERLVEVKSEAAVNKNIQEYAKGELIKVLLDGTRRNTKQPQPQNILLGRKITLELPNGEQHQGQFAIVELDNIKASHNERTFANTVGYPTNKNGDNINDRNYSGDKAAQGQVAEYARNLKPSRLITTSRTPSGTAIIDENMIVVSGNNRTMSAKLASEDYPQKWQAYKQFLKEEIDAFGFSDTNIDTFKKPFLVRIDYDFGEYKTANMAKYNQATTKEKRPVDKAVELSNILMEQVSCQTNIPAIFDKFENMSAFYANAAAQKELLTMFLQCNLITEQSKPRYFNEGSFTQNGKDFIEAVLSGIVLDKSAILNADKDGVKRFRKTVVYALPVLMVNKSLQKDSLIEYVGDAINYQANIVGSGLKFHDYINQGQLFGGSTVDTKAIYINRLMNMGQRIFKVAIGKYNDNRKNSGGGLFGASEQSNADEAFNQYIIKAYEDAVATKDKKSDHHIDKKALDQYVKAIQLNKNTDNKAKLKALKAKVVIAKARAAQNLIKLRKTKNTQ